MCYSSIIDEMMEFAFIKLTKNDFYQHEYKLLGLHYPKFN